MDIGWLGILLTCFTATSLLSVASIAVCNTMGVHLYSTEYHDQTQEEFGRVFTHLSEDAQRARELVSRHPRYVKLFHIIVVVVLALYVLALFLGGDEIAAMLTASNIEALAAEYGVSGDVQVPWELDATRGLFLWDVLWPMAIVAFLWSVFVVFRVAHISLVSYKALMP